MRKKEEIKMDAIRVGNLMTLYIFGNRMDDEWFISALEKSFSGPSELVLKSHFSGKFRIDCTDIRNMGKENQFRKLVSQGLFWEVSSRMADSIVDHTLATAIEINHRGYMFAFRIVSYEFGAGVRCDSVEELMLEIAENNTAERYISRIVELKVMAA